MPVPKPRRIVVLQGHPDPLSRHFGHALSSAYRDAAIAAGHQVRSLEVASLSFPLLESRADWEAPPPPAIVEAQESLAWADHVAIFYPLWLGSMPAVLKGFLEQVLRPGFALPPTSGASGWTHRLRGKSSRIVVTMGMPALVYYLLFGAHSLRCLKRNVLSFCGLGPNRASVVGMVESTRPGHRERWLRRMASLGAAAA